MPLRKRLQDAAPPTPSSSWLPLEDLTEVSVSSEEVTHPVDGALGAGVGGGDWRAAAPGEQSVSIHFDEPREIRLIHLVVDEAEHERLQEFAIHWSADRGRTFHLVVRQQFSFSPSGATREIEST
jgi:hypothetical protein